MCNFSLKKLSLVLTTVYRGCKVPSDHNLVVSKLRIKLEAHQKQIINLKYDVDRLKTKLVRMEYETSTGRRFAALPDREDMDAEEMWTKFKTATNEVAKKVIGFKRIQQNPWITERSRVLSQKQRRLRVEADDETEVSLMFRKINKKMTSDYPFISFTYKLKQIVKTKNLVIFILLFVTIRRHFCMLSMILLKYAGIMSTYQTFRIYSCSFCKDDGSAAHTLFFIIGQQFSKSSRSGLSSDRSNTSFSCSVSHSGAYRAL